MRRRKTTKRELIPDVKYNSELVARLINTLMKCGKKSIAQKIVYGAFDYIKTQKKDMEPLEVFIQAVENVKPKSKSSPVASAAPTIRCPSTSRRNARSRSLFAGSPCTPRPRRANP